MASVTERGSFHAQIVRSIWAEVRALTMLHEASLHEDTNNRSPDDLASDLGISVPTNQPCGAPTLLIFSTFDKHHT